MKLITVQGNKNSGKTLLSFFLGAEISQEQKKVIVIHADSFLPVVKAIMPDEYGKSIKSLGKAMLSPIANKDDIVNNIVAVDMYPNLGLTSYAQNESVNTFPVLTERKLLENFKVLATLADFIIVDCGSEKNPLCDFALSHSDVMICVTTADYRGICYRMSNPTNNTAIHIISEKSHSNLTSEISKTFENEPLVLPMCKAFGGLYNGEDITALSPTKQYKRVVGTLVKEVLSDE